MNTIVRSHSNNPWYNLALEDYLFSLDNLGAIFYLWQNQNTVVIGRHQNAWKECRTQLLEEENGRLARRTTGGGAVFHDLGNLNFTFILPMELYDVSRQCGVILKALRALGIHAEFSGRNDLTIGGAKFSGNAFRKTRERGMHHGTLIFDVDMTKLARYLAPSKAKLAAKGVESVRARVTNLTEHREDLTLEMLVEALEKAFVEEYGPARTLPESEIDTEAFRHVHERFASWEWRYGETPEFDVSIENRFDFGSIELLLSCHEGYVKCATVYSDANDEAYIDTLEEALPGARFSPDALETRVRALEGELSAPIAQWLDSVQF